MQKKRVLPLLMIGFIGLLGLGLSGCKGGDENVTAGKHTYMTYCAGCHGEMGDGKGFNAEFLLVPPANHTDPEMATRSNEKLFDVVKEGKVPKMPPFGPVFSDKEIWQLVAFMRTLHPNTAPAINFEGVNDKRPETKKAVAKLEFPLEGTPEWDSMLKSGEKLYKKKGCKVCHRIGEEGGRIGPELSRAGKRLRPEWMFTWLKSPQSVYKHTKMPNFGLSDEDATALVAFLKTQNAEPGLAGNRGDPMFFEAQAK